MNKGVKILGKSFIYLMLAVTYLPILVLIVFSFSTNKTFGDWSKLRFSFGLYAKLFADAEIMGAVGNTFVIALVSALLATFIGTISAVGLHYMRKTPRALINAMNQITVVNADIVTGVAFMLFFFSCLGGLDGYPALIIAHTMITTPYVILSVMPKLRDLNPNVYEAGLDLGASPMRTLFTIILPQLVSGMVSGFVMAFTLSLDDFVVTNFNNGNVKTISTIVYTSTKHGVDPTFRALSAIIFVLVLGVLIAINIAGNKRSKAGGK